MSSGTGAVIAATITGTVLICTQIATLIQVWRFRNRSEKFQTSQSKFNTDFEDNQRQLTAESEAALVRLKEELSDAYNLQTRWDPVRFQIYSDVIAGALRIQPVAQKQATFHGRLAALFESKGEMGHDAYESSQTEYRQEIESLEEKWHSHYSELEAAWARADLIASPRVRDAVSELVHSLQAMSAATAVIGSGERQQLDTRFYCARNDLRDAVREELGSDHYASDQPEIKTTNSRATDPR